MVSRGTGRDGKTTLRKEVLAGLQLFKVRFNKLAKINSE